MIAVEYGIFLKLYNEALLYTDMEMYIFERGWQSWMDKYDVEVVRKILETVYEYGHTTMKEVRTKHGITRAEMSRNYNIPLRTLEDWELNKNTPSNFKYIEPLILYTFFIYDINSEDDL